MRLRDVLDLPDLRLALLTGGQYLDRPVRRVITTDLLDPRRYLSGGELVLTGMMWRRAPADSEAFVAALAAADVTALGAGDAALGSVPGDLVDACRRHGVPLFAVPIEVSFQAITDEVDPSLWAERASGLATVLGRHRDLVSAMAAGAVLSDLLPAVLRGGRGTATRGTAGWVITAAGRVVAGTEPLPPPVAAELARAYLSLPSTPAHGLPRTVQIPGGRVFVVSPARTRSDHPLADWFLACVDSPGPDVLDELSSLVKLERARDEQSQRAEERLAAELASALGGPADAAEVRRRVASCGLPAEGMFMVLSAEASGVPIELVRELVRTATAEAAVTHDGDRAVAVLTLPLQDSDALVAALRETAAVLATGIGAGRLALGVSSPAPGAATLPAALLEAEHARRHAAAQPAAVTLTRAGELASHALLLAGVPAEARRLFRDRLLGPLLAYDLAHDAALMRTLETFLDCSGSWIRCAELLHVHVNTLRYRVGRIEQLTGRDLSRFEDRVDLFLALRM